MATVYACLAAGNASFVCVFAMFFFVVSAMMSCMQLCALGASKRFQGLGGGGGRGEGEVGGGSGYGGPLRLWEQFRHVYF